VKRIEQERRFFLEQGREVPLAGLLLDSLHGNTTGFNKSVKVLQRRGAISLVKCWLL
jgi:hypothetical protein